MAARHGNRTPLDGDSGEAALARYVVFFSLVPQGGTAGTDRPGHPVVPTDQPAAGRGARTLSTFRARCARRRMALISSDSTEVLMTDILIRDVPDEVLAAIDAKAKRVGISRTEYLRRALEREGIQATGPVTVEKLERLAMLTADLDDPAVMSDAWS